MHSYHSYVYFIAGWYRCILQNPVLFVTVTLKMFRLHKGQFTRSDYWFRRLEAGVQTVQFQGSVFVVRMSEGHLYCVHTIRFSKLTKNLQFSTKTITGISCKICRRLSRRVSDKNRACSISIRFFFKITDPCVGMSFSMCSHDPIFGTSKNRILKNGSVNGP